MIISVPRYCLLAALCVNSHVAAFTLNKPISIRSSPFSLPAKGTALHAVEIAEEVKTEETKESNMEGDLQANDTIIESIPVADNADSSDEFLAAKDDLKVLANKLNSIVGYYDPLSLADAQFWNLPPAGTIGFLRHAEIKHGRVAMAAFVGYCVQSNWHFPWKMDLAGNDFPSIDLSPEAQWDAIPLNAKLQMITVIGFLEFWDELGGNIGESPALGISAPDHIVPHYTKGRMPGKYPSFQAFRETVHWVPDLYDPFNNIKADKKFTEEKKERGRLAEINNGRLAMLGIIAFLAADKIPGAVPLLKDIARSYEGNTMIPFSNDFSFFASAASDTVASSSNAGVVEEVIKFDREPVEFIAKAAESAKNDVISNLAESTKDAPTFVPQLLQ